MKDQHQIEISKLHIVPDKAPVIDKHCPVCGKQLKLVTVFNGRSYYRNKRKSFECTDCNYAEYDYTDREYYITNGLI